MTVTISTCSECEFDRVSQSLISHEFTAIPDYIIKDPISAGKYLQERGRREDAKAYAE